MVPVSLFRSFCAYNLCASGVVNVCFLLGGGVTIWSFRTITIWRSDKNVTGIMPKIKLKTKMSFHLELVTPEREEVSQLIKMIMLEFLPIIILFTAG